MNRDPDDYDLERCYELEHRLDRDAEHEPHRPLRMMRRRPRYFSRLMFRPVVQAVDAREELAA